MKLARAPIYADPSVFEETLKRRAQDLCHPASWIGQIRALGWITAYIGLAAWIVQVPQPLITSIFLLFALAVLTILMAFNVCHDAVHGSLFRNRRLNDWVYTLTFNILGTNAYLWRIRHINAHHLFVNIPGSDMDIESTRLLRVAPHVPWRPIHRYQHVYCILLYSLFTLNWIFIKDFQIYRMKTFGGVSDLSHPRWRLIELLAWKAAYVGVMIALPTILLPYSVGTVLAGFIGFHLVLSTMLLIFFASSHINEQSHFVVASDGGKIPHGFLNHQLLTSVDYHPTSRLMGFFFGGFNAHVGHHVFPRVGSEHYPRISEVIAETAQEFKMPYQTMTFLEIIGSHFRMMKRLGAGPGSCSEFVVKPKS